MAGPKQRKKLKKKKLTDAQINANIKAFRESGSPFRKTLYTLMEGLGFSERTSIKKKKNKKGG